jgi:hypothetical protein
MMMTTSATSLPKVPAGGNGAVGGIRRQREGMRGGEEGQGDDNNMFVIIPASSQL